MKRLKYILLLALFIIPIRVNAASATIGVSSSTKTIVVGIIQEEVKGIFLQQVSVLMRVHIRMNYH